MAQDRIPSSRPASIEALIPDGEGHQFAFYGDSCSGIVGHPHEANLAQINDVVLRLHPSPEFVVYPGDEVIGLTGSEQELRDQWNHWSKVEMAGLRAQGIPIYNCTGNHTIYNAMSERVYREACGDLPENGPSDQLGLSYFVRRDDLLLVFVNTLCSSLGGEGHVETDWLERVLRDNGDARWTFVVGHHPVFPVNGYRGDYQRTVGPEYRDRFWRLMSDNGVTAYLCSHILAFDVQVHAGVLQITTAGAGTAHRMPEGIEYLHCVQAAIDRTGLRYQVLDKEARVREQLNWPPAVPPSESWRQLPAKGQASAEGSLQAWRFRGTLSPTPGAARQTLLSLRSGRDRLDTVWIGLGGPNRRLTVSLQPQQGRSPHCWLGPSLEARRPFDIQLALHSGMGPGGVLWRADDESPWSTLDGASPWGPERLDWHGSWRVGETADGDMPFAGDGLDVRYFVSSAS